jgi:hypothetical protein
MVRSGARWRARRGRRPRRHARRGFAGRRPAAAAIVADAVFLPVGDVGMAGAELLGDVAVILRPLVGVADHQLDRVPVETPSNTPDRISTSSASRRWVVYLFCPGFRRSSQCWIAPLPRARRGGSRRPCAERGPVAFAPGGHAEDMAEGVEGHGTRLSFRRTELSARGANAKTLRPLPQRGAAYCCRTSGWLEAA